MKTSPLRVDDLISDVAFFVLVALTTMAVLNYVSIWFVAGCFALYIVVGILVACLMAKGRGTQHQEPKRNRSADSDLLTK